MIPDSNYIYEKGTILIAPGGGGAFTPLLPGQPGQLLVLDPTENLGVKWINSNQLPQQVVSFASASLNLKNVGLTTLFTTQSTKNFIPISLTFLCDSESLANGDSIVNIGWSPTDYIDFYSGGFNVQTAQNFYNQSFTGTDLPFFPPNTPIIINIATADTGTSIAGRIVISGFYD